MKKITITVTPGSLGVPGVYHKATLIQIAKDKDFTDLTVDTKLTKDGEADTTDILNFTKILDFPLSTTKYYLRTQLIFSNGDKGPLSRVSLITKSGVQNYQLSNTIVKAPLVELTSSGRDFTTDFSFKTDHFRIYSGAGQHTATTWRLVCNNAIVWERELDATNLTSITLPDGLIKSNRRYEMCAKFHTGDVASEFGKSCFETNKENSDMFLITQDGVEGLEVFSNKIAYFKVNSRLHDFYTFEWKITMNDEVVLRSHNQPTVTNPYNPYVFYIDGKMLPKVGAWYTFIANLNGYVTKYEFRLKEDEFMVHGFVDKPRSNQLLEKQVILQDTHFATVYEDMYVPYLAMDRTARCLRAGSEVSATTSIAGTAVHKPEYPYSSQVINGKLVVQTIVEEVVNGVVVRGINLNLFDYNSETRDIHTQDAKVVRVGETLQTNSSINVVQVSVSEVIVPCIVDARMALVKVNIHDGTKSEPTYIANDYVKMPNLVWINNAYSVLVGETVKLVSNSTLQTFNIEAPSNANIDFSQWTEAVTMSNGEVFFMGLDTRVTNEELIIITKFDFDLMSFSVINALPVPKTADSTEMKKPNIIVGGTNELLFAYPLVTLWYV